MKSVYLIELHFVEVANGVRHDCFVNPEDSEDS